MPTARRSKRSKQQPRRFSHFTPRLETLEARQLMAVWVGEVWNVTDDVDNSGGLTAGDIVTDSGGTVTNKTFGTDAFSTIQAAVDTVAAGETVNVLPGEYVENVRIAKNLSLVSTGGRDVTTITGISNGALGTVLVTGNTSAVRIGNVGQGFTINGIDNPSPGIESAAVYFQGAHTGATVQGNEIIANGDQGFLTEYGPSYSNFVIDNNIFSGKTYTGDTPGSGNQWVVPNVPRQLVVMGNGGGAGLSNATNVAFTNNQITGDSGGNQLVTLDVSNSTIAGNHFAGTTTGTATALRARRPNVAIENNTFVSDGMGPGTTHITVSNNTTALEAIVGDNTFDKGAYVNGGADVSVSISGGIARASAGQTVNVLAGTYNEDVDVNKTNLTLRGEDRDTTTIKGVKGGRPDTVLINANGVIVENFTITRDGNNTDDWNDPTLNNQGVNFRQGLTGATLRDNIITGNRNGVYFNQTNGIQVLNNLIDNNHTGIQVANDVSGMNVSGNVITNNRTVGILFNFDGADKVTSSATVNNNAIHGNWYGGIVRRWTNSEATLDVSQNWFGTTTPVYTNLNSTEPGYAVLIPPGFGGTAVKPASAPDIADVNGTRLDFSPYLGSGNDTSGDFGFQGSLEELHVAREGAQLGAIGRIQEAINLATGASPTVVVHNGVYEENVLINKDDLHLSSANGLAVTSIVGTVEVAAGVADLTLGAISHGFTISGTSSYVLHFQANVSGATVEGNRIISSGAGNSAFETSYGQSNHTIQNNQFVGNGSVPNGGMLVYVLGAASYGAANASTNVNFINNTFTGNTGPNLALGLEASNSQVTGNTFSGRADFAAVELWGANTEFSDNSLTGVSKKGVGLLVSSNANSAASVVATDNTIANYERGIKIANSSGILIGNTLTNNTTGAWVLGANGSAKLEGNTIYYSAQNNSGLIADDGADVDAGGGFAGSVGGNKFIKTDGFATSGFAIRNRSTDGVAGSVSATDIYAKGNDFGTGSYAQIERVVLHDVDNKQWGLVHFGDAVNGDVDVSAPSLTDIRYIASSTSDPEDQRSMIKSIVLTFDGPVYANANAFDLSRISNTPAWYAPGVSAGEVELNVAQSLNGATGQTTVTLTFSDASDTEHGGSLIDGRYALTIDGDAVDAFFAGSGEVADDGDVTGAREEAFHRMFGDVDGDATVGAVDFLAYRAAAQPAKTNVQLFDTNEDGAVWLLLADIDFQEFRKRQGKMLP